MKAAKAPLLLLCLFCLAAPAAAAGGSGTAADPYIVQTAAELQSMQNNLGAYYQLANDIDLSSVTWVPIGTSSAAFHGSFDGNGKTISNLVISSTTLNTGFFGSITSGATIKDVTFEDCLVMSSTSWCGLVVGSIIMSSANHDVATIDNVDCVRCTVQASDNRVGAICGIIYTTAVVDISYCDVSYANVESSSTNNVGAICGACNGGSSVEINYCTVKYSSLKASRYNVGAICGACNGGSSAEITGCLAENCICEASLNDVGAICGYVGDGSSCSVTDTGVKNCVVKCTIYAGGIIGLVDKDYTNNVGSHTSATNCDVLDTTIVATSNYAGGVCGRLITPCTGVYDGCTVSGCTILATSYAAGICPAYS